MYKGNKREFKFSHEVYKGGTLLLGAGIVRKWKLREWKISPVVGDLEVNFDWD